MPRYLVLAALTLALTGCPTGRQGGGDHPLSADPEQVDFGYVAALQFSAEVSVVLTNEGSTSLTIEASPRISDDSDDAFALQLLPPEVPFTLGAGESETISAYFAPPGDGTYLGWIEVHTSADSDGPVLIPVGGCSTNPDCTVEFVDPPGDDDDDDDATDDDDDATDDDDDATGDPVLDIDPVAVDFGDVAQNQAPIGDVIQINNGGGGTLQVSSVSLTGDPEFEISGFSGGDIPAGGTPANLNVTFDPYGSAEGPKTGTVTIESNDGDVSVSLSANVTEDCGACLPELEVQGGQLLNVFLGEILYVQVSTGTASVQISNIGFGDLSVEPITEGGEICTDNPAISTISAPSTLAPGESDIMEFSVGQEGLEVINMNGTYAFTIGTLAPDPTAILTYALEAPNCNPLGP